jgi:hypothetical protein
MSKEAWLIGRKVDASKNIFVATETLLFDFELFIGGHRQLVVMSQCEGFGKRKAYTK